MNDKTQAFESEKAAFAAEKSAFEDEKLALEREKAQLAEDKRAFASTNRQVMDSIQTQQAKLDHEESRLKAWNDELERRAAEINAAAIAQRAPAPQAPAYSTPPTYASSYAPTTSPEELYRRAERDGIRLNARIGGTVKPASGQVKESKPTPIFNKGATLFKAALLTFCFLAIECIIVFFMKESLGVSLYYPLIPLAVGLIAFAICSILYASGYQSAAKLNKRSGTYIFSAVILFVVGVIVASMIAVYFKAPLATPTVFLSYIVIPAVLLTNIILFPVFYHFFALAKAHTQDEE